MKKLFAFTVAIVLSVACGRQDPTTPPSPTPDPPAPTVEGIALDDGVDAHPMFGSEGGSAAFTFTSSESWTATLDDASDRSWISFDKTSGSAGKDTFRITAAANGKPEERRAVIHLSSGKVILELIAIQNALPESEYTSTDYSRDKQVSLLQAATVGKGIDLILMGDGYFDHRFVDGTYDSHMRNAMEAFFGIEPFKSFRDCFNVYVVSVVSPNSDNSDGRRTAFGAVVDPRTGSIDGNIDAVREYASLIPNYNEDETSIGVIMNTRTDAGTSYMFWHQTETGQAPYRNSSGIVISFCPLGHSTSNFEGIIRHELGGHAFGKLADEYWLDTYGRIPEHTAAYYQMYHSADWYLNADTNPDPDTVLWNRFLKDERYATDGLGVFEGADLFRQGIYRPSYDSVMRYNTDTFNAPSRLAIYTRICHLAYGDDWSFDYEEFVKYDSKNIGASTGAATRSASATLPPLAPPVIIVE